MLTLDRKFCHDLKNIKSLSLLPRNCLEGSCLNIRCGSSRLNWLKLTYVYNLGLDSSFLEVCKAAAIRRSGLRRNFSLQRASGNWQASF